MLKIFITQDKKLLKCIMIMLRTCLEIFMNQKKKKKGTGLKILTPNQMLKRLPIALAQVKAGNNSESLLNEIRQIA